MRKGIKLLMTAMMVLSIFAMAPKGNAEELATAPDSAWSWWNYPQIVRSPKNGNYYFGFISSSQGQGIGMYNPKTNQVTRHLFGTSSKGDDHNAPAVLVLPDGKILAVYATGHNADRNMHVRVSKKAGSISSWKSDIIVRASAQTTYAQLFQYNGTVYMFYRVRAKSSRTAQWTWCMRSSRDLTTWTAEKKIVYAAPQWYCLLRPTTQNGLLRIVMTSNPAARETSIRTAFLDLKTLTLFRKDGKTKIKTLDSVGSPYTDFEVVLEQPADGRVHRLFDVAVTKPASLKFAFARMHLAADGSADRADYCLYKNGKTSTVFSSDKAFWNSYFGGMSFIGAGDNLRLVTSHSQGGYDYLVLSGTNGVKVSGRQTLAKTATDGNVRMIRPIVSPDGSMVMYQHGLYNPSSYVNFSLSARFAAVK